MFYGLGLKSIVFDLMTLVNNPNYGRIIRIKLSLRELVNEKKTNVTEQTAGK